MTLVKWDLRCCPLGQDKTRVFLCACTCISAYDETPRKELEAVAACESTVYIMCSEFWRVRPGRAVSLCRGRGHRLMGQIMVRLIRTGSMFVGRVQRKEGRKVDRMKSRKEGNTVPPRLSLSAGFTWIGLFICDRDRKRRKDKTHNRKGRKIKKKTGEK